MTFRIVDRRKQYFARAAEDRWLHWQDYEDRYALGVLVKKEVRLSADDRRKRDLRLQAATTNVVPLRRKLKIKR